MCLLLQIVCVRVHAYGSHIAIGNRTRKYKGSKLLGFLVWIKFTNHKNCTLELVLEND